MFVCIVKMTELKECMGRVFIDGAFEFAVPEVSTLHIFIIPISITVSFYCVCLEVTMCG